MRFSTLCKLIVAASMSLGAAGITLWAGYSDRWTLAWATLALALLVEGLFCAWNDTRCP